MKRVRFLIIAAVLIVIGQFGVHSFASGHVTYSGNVGNFIFAPGSAYSPTDLFTNMKGVMPGGTYTDTIHIGNHADDRVQVKIYMRSLGAEPGSEDFLSMLRLKVEKASAGEGSELFDAPSDETAALTDWVYIGTLNAGGSIDLNLTITVPEDLSNEYANRIGYLDWEFKAEEIPLPDVPNTGDSSMPVLWASLSAGSLLAIILFLILWRRKDRKEKQ